MTPVSRSPDAMPARPPRPRAFTLIELVVVIAILSVLMGLLLPALQSAREQSRRSACMNNLKQVGLALAMYNDGNGALPAGYYSGYDTFGRRETGPGWGWGSLILPYLEQQPLADQIQLGTSISDPVHATVRTTVLSVFLCPSDNMPHVWTTENAVMWYYAGGARSSSFPVADVGGSNYIGVFGIGEPGVDGDGVFYRNSAVRLIDITDGLTNTVCVGERAVSMLAGRGNATWAGVPPGTNLWTCVPNPNDPDGGTCREEQGAGVVLGHTGESRGPSDPWGDVNQFVSRHERGAHFLFGDGHVRYLKYGMNYPTYKALSTRASGEVINDF